MLMNKIKSRKRSPVFVCFLVPRFYFSSHASSGGRKDAKEAKESVEDDKKQDGEKTEKKTEKKKNAGHKRNAEPNDAVDKKPAKKPKIPAGLTFSFQTDRERAK